MRKEIKETESWVSKYKFIASILAVAIFFSATVYGIELSWNTSIRKELSFSSEKEKKRFAGVLPEYQDIYVVRQYHRIRNLHELCYMYDYGFWTLGDSGWTVFTDEFYHNNDVYFIPPKTETSIDIVLDIPSILCSGTTIAGLNIREGVRPDVELFEKLREDGLGERADKLERYLHEGKLAGLTAEEFRRFINWDAILKDEHNQNLNLPDTIESFIKRYTIRQPSDAEEKRGIVRQSIKYKLEHSLIFWDI